MSDTGIVKLKNVRLSFPALHEARGFQGSKPAFSAVFLLNKKANIAEIALIKKAIETVTKEKWPKGTPKNMKPPCLHDGSEKEDVDGYGDDMMYVSARSSKRIPVVGPDLTPLTEEDGKPYAGCFVNASIRLWAQDNEFGKRINAQLRVVQFLRDGEPFGEKPADAEAELGRADGGSSDEELI